MSLRPIRVLVVDDSAVVRGLIARAIESDPALELSGTAMHGQAALQSLRKTPADVVVMDVEMPVMDGITALPKILSEFPGVRVIMASSLTGDGAETTVKALSLGASGCIEKPTASCVSDSISKVTAELVPLVKALANGRAKTAPSRPVESAELRSPPRLRPRVAPAAVVIGVSTGGPQALRVLLGALPPDFPLPIFIVQHMPPLFTPMLAKHLQADTGRVTREAGHLEVVQNTVTYVAPGDFHLEIQRKDGQLRTCLTQAAPEHYCRPSVNPLFRSAARVFGPQTLAVMLTGMGGDGLDGSRDVVNQDGYLIAQDEASSVVWGMPGSVVRAGLAHAVLPLEQIAPRILQACLAEVSP